MENQMINRIRDKVLKILSLILIFFWLESCKGSKTKEQWFFSETNKINSFEIIFLNKNIQEIHNLGIKKAWEEFLKEDHSQYIKKGVPVNELPFIDFNCFYSLDEFSFYNEFGLKIKICNEEIQNHNSRIINFLKDQISNDDFSSRMEFNEFSINTSKNLNFLENKEFLVFYDSNLYTKFNFSTRLYIHSYPFFEENDNYIPRRFQKNRYGIFINEKESLFVYKINKKYIIFNFNNSVLYGELINSFILLKNFIKDIKSNFNSGEIFLSEILFKNKVIKKIKISTKQNAILEKNQIKNQYFFIFPFSNLLIDLEDFFYEFRDSKISLYLTDIHIFDVDKIYILDNHWLVYHNFEFIPLSLCLWENPCSIQDLNYLDFQNSFNESSVDCKIENLQFTEINPVGLYSGSLINSYAKFIEIFNPNQCKNENNIIYLKIDNFLIPFPEEIPAGYYIFTGSKESFIIENVIESHYLQNLKPYSRISFVQFFPYKEVMLDNSFTDKDFFIYGDKENQIFKKIHSLIVRENKILSFHSQNCKGLIFCDEYGMSPGYSSFDDNTKVCSISEIFVDGPLQGNKTLSSDEFIEFKCEDSESTLNFFKITYQNQTKTFYFPSPLETRFSFFAKNPECILSDSKSFIVNNNISIPNAGSVYETRNQKILISEADVLRYAKGNLPRSFIFVESENIVLPSIEQNLFSECVGSATPSMENQMDLYLVRKNHNTFRIISDNNSHSVKIYLNNFVDEFVYKKSDIINVSTIVPLIPQERILVKFIIDNEKFFYRESFLTLPLCSIDAIHSDSPEWLRICFYDSFDFSLYIRDEVTSSSIVSYKSRFSTYDIENEYLAKLEKTQFKPAYGECAILIEPFSMSKNFFISYDSRDTYLVTTSSNKIGNGIRNDESIEVFTYLNNQRISLCSYGIPELKLVPYSIPRNHISVKKDIHIPYSDFENFDIIK